VPRGRLRRRLRPTGPMPRRRGNPLLRAGRPVAKCLACAETLQRRAPIRPARTSPVPRSRGRVAGGIDRPGAVGARAHAAGALEDHLGAEARGSASAAASGRACTRPCSSAAGGQLPGCGSEDGGRATVFREALRMLSCTAMALGARRRRSQWLGQRQQGRQGHALEGVSEVALGECPAPGRQRARRGVVSSTVRSISSGWAGRRPAAPARDPT